MTRTVFEGASILVAAAALAGCAARRPVVPEIPPPPPPPDARAEACAAPARPAVPTFSSAPAEELPEGARVVDVKVRGARGVPRSMILGAMATHAGDRVGAEAIDRDLLRVAALGTFEDVRIAWEPAWPGVVLVVEVDERPALGAIFFAPDAHPPEPDRWFAPLAGDLYDPAALARSLRGLQKLWNADGHLDARAAVRARRVDEGRVDLCFDLDPGPVWTVEGFDLPGASVVPADDLLRVIDTRGGRFNAPGEPYRADLLPNDLLRMAALQYDHGLLESKIGAPSVTRLPDRHALRVAIPVTEGPVYRIGRLGVGGHLAGPRSAYTALVGQAPGEVFSRARMIETIERLKDHHRALTGKDAAVEPVTSMHVDRATVDVELVVKGG